MNDKLNMDKQIREKLDGFSVAPPPHVWNNIQGQMVAQQKKKRLAYVGWISAAAVVVFAFVAGWLLNEQSNTLAPQLVEQEINAPHTPKGEETTVTPANNKEEEEEVQISVEETIQNERQTVQLKTTISKNKTIPESKQTATVVAAQRKSYELLESMVAVFKKDTEATKLKNSKRTVLPTEETDELLITAHDELLMAQNAKNLKQNQATEKGWRIGAHVSPGYSSHSANHEKQYAENMTYGGNSGAGNVGGGFSVQYKTGKRLRVESGVYYAQNGQSANRGSGGLFGFRENSDMVYATPEYLGDAAAAFSNIVQLNNDGLVMNSVAGVINMRATPKGASVATNSVNTDAKFANTLNTNGEFSQVFEFVEVPLYIRYSVLDKRFGIELLGGLNAGFTVGNTAYIENSHGKQDIGKTEDISSVNFSGTVGVGMNYMLGKHLSLAFEPRINYYLNSINTNPAVDYRPYRVGFYTGIYYEF